MPLAVAIVPTPARLTTTLSPACERLLPCASLAWIVIVRFEPLATPAVLLTAIVEESAVAGPGTKVTTAAAVVTATPFTVAVTEAPPDVPDVRLAVYVPLPPETVESDPNVV